MFYVQYYNNKKYNEKYQEQWELQNKIKSKCPGTLQKQQFGVKCDTSSWE